MPPYPRYASSDELVYLVHVALALKTSEGLILDAMAVSVLEDMPISRNLGFHLS
jgi:hypothetical protein